jgi:hypothetical protein
MVHNHVHEGPLLRYRLPVVQSWQRRDYQEGSSDLIDFYQVV